MREITEQQYRDLEAHHGQGMVVVMYCGDDEFAFRRPAQLDVDLVLADKAAGRFTFHEDCAIRCLLSPEAPAAGGPVADKVVPTELVAERLRMRALWKEAPLTRDTLTMGLAERCGWHPTIDATALGGGRYRITAKSAGSAITERDIDISFEARILAPEEYTELRMRQQTMPEGAAERYAWAKQVDASVRDALARLYPYLVIGVGNVLQTLGSEGRTVRVKKFGGGQAGQPGSTTETQAETAT